MDRRAYKTKWEREKRANDAEYKARQEESRKEYMAKSEYAKTPRFRYHQQRTAARRRGVEFEMTFEEWWRVWEPHWEQRGKQAGELQMCRHGDTGPYSVDNIYIATVEQNRQDAGRVA